MKLDQYLDSQIIDETSNIFSKEAALNKFNKNPNEKVYILTQKLMKDIKYFSIDTLTVDKNGDILLVESGNQKWVP